MSFPKEHRAKLHSTHEIDEGLCLSVDVHRLERRSGLAAAARARRTEVAGILPNGAAITRLGGAILLAQNGEWAVQRACHMTLATVAPLRDDLALMLPAAAV